MRGTTLAGLALAAAIVGTATQARSQGGGPPIIHPKDPPATLLIVCDLACNWKLDGLTKGHNDADSSSKAKVELGEHILVVATEDGLDQIKVTKEVKATGQTVLDIELKPVRDKRISAAKPPEPTTALLVTCDLACNWTLDGTPKGAIEAQGSLKVPVEAGQHKVVATTEDGKDKFSLSAEAKTGTQTLVSIALQPVRDARNKKKLDQDKDAQAAAAGLIWTDPATQITWTTKDNAKNVNWKQAADYCKDLLLADHTDWRMPSIDELQGIFDPGAYTPGVGETGSPAIMHVKGNLHLTGWQWSRSQPNTTGEAWGFSFANGKRLAGRFTDNLGNRSLCVRSAENQ
jgi:hypothetical protein